MSYYEADAFARWSGARLPTEAEWEVAARAEEPRGNFLESENFHPMPAMAGTGLAQCFGDVWEWTQSPYTALSRDEAGRRGPRRIQREVHVQPARAAGRIVRDSRVAYPSHLPEFLPPRGSLAIHGNPPGEELMTRTTTTIDRHDVALSGLDRFRHDVWHGLALPRKDMPCKYLYDDRGSALFDEICELDEYYLTRTELAILDGHVDEMADAIGPDCELIELGSGSGLKTRLLLEHLREPRAYMPVDISAEPLSRSAAELSAPLSLTRDHPDLRRLHRRFRAAGDRCGAGAARGLFPRLDDRQLPSDGRLAAPALDRSAGRSREAAC